MIKVCGRFLFVVLLFVGTNSYAQVDEFRSRFDEFTQQAKTEYDDFRDRANKDYAEFMRRAWEEYQALPEIPKPKDEPPVPPVPCPEDDKDTPVKDTPVPYDDYVPVVTPEPQPKPVNPIREQPQPTDETFSFTFFGTKCKVRLGVKHRFVLSGKLEDALSDGWGRLASNDYNNVIRDCLELRIRHQLCDWAYLLMLQELSDAYFGKGTNESTLLCAYLYCQSGYQMRLGQGHNRLYMLVASKHVIFETPYWEIDGMYYYPFNCDEQSLKICGATFPNEQPLSLMIYDTPLLSEHMSGERTFKSERYQELTQTMKSDQNLIQFFSTYPTSMLGENECSRWAMYANTPMSESVKNQLYPVLRRFTSGKTLYDAVNGILNFVQTAFEYEYDDKVWGGDRAFFSEESLFYPYCDCEDRSILFSRLVRDLLGLKVVLVYYPGHLATAVEFTELVKGDYISLDGRKFVICDPTYIGAPVGRTMPDMDNRMAKVIELN